MADTANIATCGEGNPSHTKTGNTPRDVRDNRDDSALEASGPAAWHALLDRYRSVEALPCDEATEDDIDLAGDLVGRLLTMPAPDSAALLWKLDWLLADQGGATASYSFDYVAQTVADYRRVLGAN